MGPSGCSLQAPKRQLRVQNAKLFSMLEPTWKSPERAEFLRLCLPWSGSRHAIRREG